VTACRLCHVPLVTRVLNLGEQPPSDLFPLGGSPDDDPTAPLELWMCERCLLVQLGSARFPEEMPLAVESSTMIRLGRTAVTEVLGRCGLARGARVAEAASHHGGSWLPHLAEAGMQARSLDDARDGVDLLVDVHALAHMEDTAGALRARASALSPFGWLVLEFHHLLPLVRQGQFDAVRHGHPVYLSLLALQPALEEVGLSVKDVTSSDAFGGSIRVYCRRDAVTSDAVDELLRQERSAGLGDAAALSDLQRRAARSSKAMSDYLARARAAGRRIAGYGAPSKASVLLRHAGITCALLPFTADLSPAKQGRRLGGTDIPIVSPQQLLEYRPNDVLIFTWDIAAEIVGQLGAVTLWGGRFMVPIPELREVG